MSNSSTTAAPSPLAALDRWVASDLWHPRLLPFIIYIVGLFVIQLAGKWSLWTYPFLYVLQCTVVVWLLWRYRRLTPELTIRFHWLAVPIGLGLAGAWVGLGRLMLAWQPERFDYSGGEPHDIEVMFGTSPALAWSSLVLRLLGMSLIVPLFEELFIRSAMLRGLHHPRPTALGIVQLLEDLPLVGEWIGETRIGHRAATAPPMLTRQLVQTPLGHLTLFGVAASTFVFMLSHVPRDWPGCIACGVAWCGLLWWTNRRGAGSHNPGPDTGSDEFQAPSPRLGLGPVAWSHGITNAALWAYCVAAGDWQWL